MSNPRYKISSNVILYSDEDLFVVYDSKGGKVFELNEVAFYICEKCNHPIDLKAICDLVSQEYTVDFDLVEVDTKEILSQFLENNIVCLV